MASQTPTTQSPMGGSLVNSPYVHGWAAMTRMMVEGASWSGHERHNCFLNLGDGTFADISAVSGADFDDDGRTVVQSDWDGDGDLDLWLRHRTGPQLRFMRNDQPPADYVLLELQGRRCNRDAVGARVELQTADRTVVRVVSAGDGYIAQASRRLHFGLAGSTPPVALSIHWPAGEIQRLGEIAINRTYHVVQGQDPVERPTPVMSIADGPAQAPDLTGRARIVLRAPLPLPPSVTAELSAAGGRSKLVNLWAQWCAPCIQELTQLADQYTRLHQAGLDVVVLGVDAPEDHAKARRLFQEHIASRMTQPAFDQRPVSREALETLDLLRQHIVHRPGELPTPMSLLVDPDNAVQVLYIGPVEVDQVLEDFNKLIRDAVPASRRAAFPGRWYFRIERDLTQLSRDLEQAGRLKDAAFYRPARRSRR